MCHSVISALVAPGTQSEPAASHVRISRIQLLLVTRDLADTSGTSEENPIECRGNIEAK